jgi:hypothetical protein
MMANLNILEKINKIQQWRKTMKKLLLSMCCLILFCSCSGNDSGGDNALVTFKGGSLTKEDLSAHLAGLQRSSQFKDKPETLTPEFVFEHALNMEMIIASGLDEKLHLDPNIRNELHKQMSDLFLKLMEDKLITPIDRNSITEEEMTAFYEQNKEQYQDKARYTIRTFSIALEQGEEAVSAIRQGTLDFSAAAAKYALDEDERSSGGQTGTRTIRRFQTSWQPVVESLKVGEVTGPTQIDGKAYILLLERKTEPHQYSFEEKKAFIKNDVLYSRYQDQWQQTYDRMRQQFKVKINQEKLDKFYAEAAKDNQTGTRSGQTDKGGKE